MAHLKDNKDQLLARVRRLAGQIAAIERAVQADAGCSETLHLVAGVRGAVNGLMGKLVDDHLVNHVAAPGLSDRERADAAEELQTLLRRHNR
ncbi:MAG: metal/formaldehyde-sensitive transcriptional repressor [Rhodospirillaceae bacterium]|nr:metal/formaldehyde-sensitive transcriptional repressor [Rhodospirillaceae bacterium]